MSIPSMEEFIDALRADISAAAPELMTDFETYANEAIFGRRWLDADLKTLKPGDEVLEVGAGMFLLACQLKREGFAVTALEPVGEGFANFYRLQAIILRHAKIAGLEFPILACPAEELAIGNRFALAYSINVMEHVHHVRTALERVYASLTPGGYYHFVCPNYSFPYESHFTIPIFLTKERTWRLMKNRIIHSVYGDNSLALWSSLNWITVSQVRRIAASLSGRKPVFDSMIFAAYIDRIGSDSLLKSRHNKWLRLIVTLLYSIKIGIFIRYMPPQMLPVMDCKIKKNEANLG